MSTQPGWRFVVAAGQRQQGEVAGGALDDGADGRVRRLGAHDQVAFVVAGDQAALDLGGPLPDRYRVDDPAAHLAPAAAAAHGPPGPQAGLQLPLQPAARVAVDSLVDRLAADSP